MNKIRKKQENHKMSYSREHKCWTNMIQRCYNPNHPNYDHYGGRGIIVCEEWLNSFIKFYEDMGNVPDGYSIERIDVNGNYCKENCCWISQKLQTKNRTNTVLNEEKAYAIRQLYEDGFSISDISIFSGISESTIRSIILNISWK